MKQLATLLVLGVLAFAAYRFGSERFNFGSERVNATAEEATETLGISTQLGPRYKALLEPLDEKRPVDLAAPLNPFKAQIREKQAQAGAAKQPVYNQAITFLDAMSSLAEERNKALASLLRTSATKTALDNPTKTGSSSAFFTQSIVKRWEDEKTRRKPTLDQAFNQLRSLESEWNKRVKPNAPMERYSLPSSSPVNVSAK